MDLLERGPALDALAGYLSNAAAGKGCLVLVGGEAGIGKSSVVRRFSQLQSPGTRVLWGACDGLFTPRPLGPLLDIAGQLGGRLAELFTGPAPREQLFTAFLRELNGPQRTVAVFEDVHWADEATLDLLRFIGRRLASAPSLLIVTYRDDEVRAPLQIVLGDLASLGGVAQLKLSPLSEEAVATLARERGVDPVRLYRRTAGNPFFVTEVLAAEAGGIPLTVRDAILARAGRLSPPARAVVDTASLIGTSAEISLLVEVLQPDPSAIDECVGGGIVRAEKEVLSFRHELSRIAIQEAVLYGQRIATHRRILSVLTSAPRGTYDIARLAYHAEEASDKMRVLEYAPAAARHAASLGAHREAAAQYERAIRFAKGLEYDALAVLLEDHSYECQLTGQLEEAVAARRQALDCRRQLGNTRKEGENLGALSWLLWLSGRHVEAEDASRHAIELLERLPPGPELAMAYSAQSHLRMLTQDLDEAVVWGERAIDLARRLGEVATLVHALNNVGSVRLNVGKEEGRPQLEESLRLAREAGLEEHVARALANLVAVAVRTRDYARLDHYAEEAIAYCTEHDLDTVRFLVLAWKARSLFDRAAWTNGSELANGVLSSLNAPQLARCIAQLVLGWTRTRRGDPDPWGALDEALELATSIGGLKELWPVRAARAETFWFAGDVEGVRGEARAGLDLAQSKNDPWAIGEMSFWMWRARDIDAPPNGAAEPYALQMSGDWARAAALWEKFGCPYEAAMAWADGPNEDALRMALDTFERLGARPAAASVMRRLRRLGARNIPRGPRPTTRAHPANLTRRETEILVLVADGLQNVEIANRLYLSPKTVGHHVSSILGKLGVRTRTEAAKEFARLTAARPHGEPAAPR